MLWQQTTYGSDLPLPGGSDPSTTTARNVAAATCRHRHATVYSLASPDQPSAIPHTHDAADVENYTRNPGVLSIVNTRLSIFLLFPESPMAAALFRIRDAAEPESKPYTLFVRLCARCQNRSDRAYLICFSVTDVLLLLESLPPFREGRFLGYSSAVSEIH